MLSREARLHTAAEFAAVIKGGRRSGTRRLVVHLLTAVEPRVPRAGFVVSGKVGNSVVRHRVTRRLRPLVREQLRSLPPGTALVIRALPLAATATSAELGEDLLSGIGSAVRKARSAAVPPAVRGSRATATSSPGAGSTGAATLPTVTKGGVA